MEAQENQTIYTEEDIKKNKVFAVLAYMGILVLVPALAARDSAYAKFHTNQGLVLFICNVVWNVFGGGIRAIVKAMFWYHTGPMYGMVCAMMGLVQVGLFILMICGIVNAASGKTKELPIIGRIHILN